MNDLCIIPVIRRSLFIGILDLSSWIKGTGIAKEDCVIDLGHFTGGIGRVIVMALFGNRDISAKYLEISIASGSRNTYTLHK